LNSGFFENPYFLIKENSFIYLVGDVGLPNEFLFF